MTPTQRLLFGKFTREAGIPSRFPLFSENHFDSFMKRAGGTYNLYSSIARYEYPDYYCSKIFYDFDSSWSGLFNIEATPPEKFEILRKNPDLAEEFLGEVIEEAKRLVKISLKQGIPVIGAFTGKGIHVYQLYQEEKNPKEEMISTANKFKEELNLNHLDPKPIGDVMRIARIPGSQRIWGMGDRAVPCPVYTTPLSVSEMRNMDAEWLLSVSETPRTIEVKEIPKRPKMTVYDDYLRRRINLPQREFNEESATIDDDFLEWLVTRIVKMPCVSKRALTNNPSHDVRLNFAVHLFNSGLKPNAVLNIISRMSWKDFDRQTTKKQLRQIYSRGYVEMSCRTMYDSGLCVHDDNPRECNVYGWNGSDKVKWKN